MPWIKKDGKEEFVRPPRPALDWDAPLPEGMREGTPEAWAHHTAALRAKYLWHHRLIIEWTEFYKYCPRKACRRAGACLGKDVACYDEALPALREHFYPRLREAMRSDAPIYESPSRRIGP